VSKTRRSQSLLQTATVGPKRPFNLLPTNLMQFALDIPCPDAPNWNGFTFAAKSAREERLPVP
jgi:hypothetical protein